MFVVQVLTFLLLSSKVQGEVIRITAESNTTNFWFQPNAIAPSVGDILEFHFLPKNHSVALGDFLRPCRPATAGAFFSGYNFATTAGEAPKVFRVQINNTNPLVWYCTQGNHCLMGMAGVANPAGDSTLAKYQADAKGANVVPAQAPDRVGGGQIVNNPSFTAVSTSATGTGTATTVATTTTIPSSTTTTPTHNAAAAAATSDRLSLAGMLVGAIGAAALIL